MDKGLSLLRHLLSASLLTVVWLLFFGQAVQAETIVLSDTIPTKTTNWRDELTIPAFQSAWGELTSVTMTLETPIAGSVSYENTSAETVLITSTHAVSINLQLLNHAQVNLFPSVIRTDLVPPYDGVSDFQGPSGDTFLMNTTLLISTVYTTEAALNLFYDTDLLRFPITATGASFIQGPGNFDAILRAQAAGVIFTLYFHYLPVAFELEKLTNGRDADGATGADLPVVFPGDPVTWTYIISNTGQMTLTLDEIVLTDSDPTVKPQFDPTSDDGDSLLAPGEVWRYVAVGTALNLQQASPAPTIVDGCGSDTTGQTLRAYQNRATVVVRDNRVSDLSHYCNPTPRIFAPAIVFEKFINNFDADGPDDPDVPLLVPGEPITWTYLVTNTGDISFTLAQVFVTDDDLSLTIVFDNTSDDGDNLLAPGEQWRYYATDIARDLMVDITDITTVAGCGAANPDPRFVAYRNIGTVTVNQLRVSDPGHYCNLVPTALDDERTNRSSVHNLYLPVIAK